MTQQTCVYGIIFMSEVRCKKKKKKNLSKLNNFKGAGIHCRVTLSQVTFCENSVESSGKDSDPRAELPARA